MKKLLFTTIAVTFAAALAFTGCSKAPAEAPAEKPAETPVEAPAETPAETPAEAPAETATLTIGATALPHAEILNFVKDDLAAVGVELVVQEFGDYTLINPALAEGQIDANFFQHSPYLTDFVSNSGADIVEVAKIHIEPLGIYSQEIADLSELADGSAVAIPNDTTNEARALLLLQSQGLIKLADGAGLEATPSDIVENPKNLVFNELDAAVLPRAMSETAISVINTNYALEANLNPTDDSLAIEGSDSPYANIIVVRGEDKDNEAVKKLVDALQTDKVKEFILESYEGAVVPAF